MLISDIGMPGSDGFHFVRQVQQAGLTIPAIALTAYGQGEDAERALGVSSGLGGRSVAPSPEHAYSRRSRSIATGILRAASFTV